MSLGPEARKLFDAYRAEHTLAPERREDLLMDLRARFERGELGSLDIDPDMPHLPKAGLAWSVKVTLVGLMGVLGTLLVLGPRFERAGTRTNEPRSDPSMPKVVEQPVASPENEATAREEQPTSIPGRMPESFESPALAPRPRADISRRTPPASRRSKTPEGRAHEEQAHASAPAGTWGKARASQPESGPTAAPLESEPVREPAPSLEPPSLASPPPSSSSSLQQPTASLGVDEEVKLLARAHTLLGEKRPLDALAVLREHAVRFPRGQLTDSRELTRVLALCAAGQHENARQRAASFLAAHPESPFASRIRSACAPSE